MKFEQIIIENTVEKLINGEDYRQEVINAINVSFLDFAIDFFKKIVEAKIDDKDINFDWYKANFINSDLLSSDESAIYAGINKKTINNIYGNAKKDVVLDVANANFE